VHKQTVLVTHEEPACPSDFPAESTVPPAPSRLKIVAAFAAVYVVWGSTYLAIRIGVETLPPFSMAGVRFLIAGLMMYAFVRPRVTERPTARNWLATGIVGCLMLLGGNGLVCWAEQTVASGLAALLVATVPIWMVVLDWLIYRGPRPSRAIVLGLVVGLAGIYVLIGPEDLGGERLNVLGGVALLLACVFWALGSLHSRRAALPHSSWLATAMEMIVGGVALLVVGALTGETGHISLQAISLRSVLALAYLIVFGSMVGLTSYKWLLHVCAPARVATYAYVNPVIAILLGALVGEPLTPRVALAAAVIVAAVVIITRYSAPSPRRT
jgi:drug/metabolite transporter (DMT)-like permease